jgi:hypothetical protein
MDSLTIKTHSKGVEPMTQQLLALTLLAAIGAVPALPQVVAFPTTLPPDAYEHVFRHVAHLQAKDAAITVSGGRAANYGSYYKKLANLTQSQADALQSVSQAALKDLAAIDQQAQALIVQAHAQRPPGQKLPPPPAQLASLQAQRSALLSSYRTQLQTALGPAAFANLQQALLANFKISATVSTGK